MAKILNKCMIPRPVKKGERLTIEGVEYVAAFIHPVPDSIFYLVTLRPYEAAKLCQAGETASTPAP